MRLRVLYHGNCFDGSSSAGLFSRFFRERVSQDDLTVTFAPLEHKGGGGPAVAPALLDGDVNAVVDFRYTQDPRVGWWFDHHVSAFQGAGDEEHFRADISGKKFFNPKARSCAKFLATTAAAKFGFDTAPLAELIEWAEIIDGALFPSPAMPVEMKEPALRLMTWVENNRDQELAERFIEDLVSRPLGEIAESPFIVEPLGPIEARHRKNIEVLKEASKPQGGVVFTDLIGQSVGILNKFIVYYHHPDARYAVTMLSTDKRVKVSVGSNPWSKVPRTHNIAAICERYGGGGHPVVGAISMPIEDIDRARTIVQDIVAELQGPAHTDAG